jgi:ribosomal-protein-serine acetyltransferase
MEQLLEFLPDRLATARQILRVPCSADAVAWNDAVVESFEALRPYVPWAAKGLPSREQSEGECRRMQARFLLREDLTLLMFERDAQGGEGDLLGAVGLYRIDWKVRRFEIGYWCRTGRTGRGFVVEAVSALTRSAFDRLQALRVELRVDELNQRSWRVAELAGYVLEGVLRSESLAPNGEPRDLRVYAMTRVAPSTPAPGSIDA